MPHLTLSSKVHRISHSFLILNLIIAFIFMRLPNFVHLPILRFIIYLSFFIGFIFSTFSCFKLNKKITFGILIFIFFIFLHAFIQYFLPSFQSGIAFQNYILQETFTSSFAIAQTRLFLLFPILLIFPVLSLYLEGLQSDKRDYIIKLIFLILLLAIFFNDIIIIIQHFWNFKFLWEGSGTSIDSHRPPGLFSDSGESGAVYSLAYGSIFFLPSLFNSKSDLYLQKNITRLLILLIFILTTGTGFLINSRIYFFSFTIISVIFLLSQCFQLKRIKSVITGTCFVLLGISYYLYHSQIEQRIFSIFKKLYAIKGDFFTKYAHIDFARANHLRVMWHAIKEHFWTGTGVGSFHQNLYSYYSLFSPKDTMTVDLPTNIFLQLTSELGPVGLGIIIFVIISLSRKAFIFVKNRKKTESQLLSLISLSVFLIIPFLCIFFIGYNLIFPSITILILLTILSEDKIILKSLNILTYSGSLYLLLVCVFFLNHMPRVPEFRWKENHQPQIPMDAYKLPQPDGHKDSGKLYFSEFIRKIFPIKMQDDLNQKTNGRWLHFNNELLLTKNSVRIYIPHLTSFPRIVDINYISADTKTSLKKSVEVKKPGWIDLQVPQESAFKDCYSNISESHFCSYKLQIDKNLFSSVLFYIEDTSFNI